MVHDGAKDLISARADFASSRASRSSGNASGVRDAGGACTARTRPSTALRAGADAAARARLRPARMSRTQRRSIEASDAHGALTGRGARLAAAGHQRDRRRPPHQPRPRALAAAALERVSAVAARLPQSRIRPRRRASAARGHVHAERCSRRLTGAEAAIVVNNNAAATLLILAALAAGREVIDLARRAGRDRRRLPHPRRHGAVGRVAARGRHDQPHALADYARAIDAARRRCAARPSEQLPHRGLHAAGARRAGRRRPREAAAGRRGPRQRLPLGRSRRTSRRCRRRSRPAPTWSASAATSCSAVRRPASSSAARRWSTRCAASADARAPRRQDDARALEATLLSISKAERRKRRFRWCG